MFGRNKVAMIVAEFLGTAILAVAVFSMSRYSGALPFLPSPAFIAGLTAGLMVLVVGDISGAHINPAVTYGLWTVRKISTYQAVVYITAQMLGGLAAWQLLKYLAVDSRAPLMDIAGKNIDVKVMIAEGLGAFVFITGVAAAVYKKFDGLQKAFTIGASLTLGILVASIFSNGVVNPAVAVGIRSFNVSYVVGPLVGAAVATNLYALLFAPQEARTSLVRRAVSATRRSTPRARGGSTRRRR
ncbi:MAG TPA: aquaporin [Candidatus Saccharimonadales bacterium]|nr:aquaporin [Candidatus Saccharimonadales bacterium]